jgi:receptor protein-tyrosine kinase
MAESERKQSMDIIEAAAKRLEELGRAGIEVPWAAAGTTEQEVRALTARLGVDPNQAASASDWRRAAPVALARSMGLRKPPTKPKRSVNIDLARLAAMEYLVPSQGPSTLAEEMRVIKRPIIQNARAAASAPGDGPQRANLVLVTSALPGEGKTYFAMNLAMSIAMEVDHSVLLIDGDVMRPTMLTRYGLEPQRGLMDLLSDSKVEIADVELQTNVPSLSLLPAGSANAATTELLASQAMGHLLDELAMSDPNRMVIFDAPPLLVTTAARVLASRVGQVVVIVEADKTPRQDVEKAFETLEECPIVLSVLNRSTAPGNSNAFGYY